MFAAIAILNLIVGLMILWCGLPLLGLAHIVAAMVFTVLDIVGQVRANNETLASSRK